MTSCRTVYHQVYHTEIVRMLSEFGAPPGGEAPSVVDLVMSVRVFTLNPKRSGYSLTTRSALFPRLQPRLNLLGTSLFELTP